MTEASRFGATTVHVVTHDLLTDYGPDAWAEGLGQLADEVDAEVVMSVGTDRGNEVLAQVAARGDPALRGQWRPLRDRRRHLDDHAGCSGAARCWRTWQSPPNASS